MKKLKTFLEFIAESPELSHEISRESIGNNLIHAVKLQNSNSGEFNIGHDVIMFHGDRDVPHSISHFSRRKDFYVHQNTFKGEHGSVDKIIDNMDTMAKRGFPVQSDFINSPGAVSLWRKVSSKFPSRTSVLEINPVSGEYKHIGHLHEFENHEVWGTSPAQLGRVIRLTK
jgi:hypothetical protein